jgi:aminoglycoside phosphotransferase (APT) family kinase protein
VKRLAEGRASEIFDLGDGRVLRRFKRGGDPQFEARVMEHARAHGFPAPAVHEVRADALVLERVEGPTMLEAMDLQRDSAQLARLHRQLHEIPFEGAALLHLDLHPDNVILSPAGPVVIDWTNAASGDPMLDVALVWVILVGTGLPPADEFALAFVSHFDDWERGLPDAVAYRFADPNVTDDERTRVASRTERRIAP